MPADAAPSSARPRRDWGAWLAAACTLYVAAYLVWLVAPWTPQALVDRASDLASLPVGLTALLLTLRTAAQPRLEPRLRRAWRTLGVALGVYWLGDLYWMLNDQPDLSLADVAYLAFYPMAMWALVSFPTERAGASARARFRLDAAAVLLGGGMVVWYYVLGPLVRVNDSSPLEAFVAIAAPLGDLMLFFGCVAVALRRPVGGSRAALGGVAAGLTMYLVADLIYSAQSLADTFSNGGLADALWIVGYLAIALGAHAQHRQAAAGRPDAGADARPDVGAHRPPRLLVALPYAAVAAGYALLLADAGGRWTERTGALTIGAVLLTLVVLLRQAHALRENARLQLEMEARRSEARFRSLVQHASDLVTVLDAEGVVRWASPASARVVGHEAEALLGMRLHDLVVPDDAAVATELLTRLAAGPGVTARLDVRLRHAAGHTLHGECVGTNLLHESEVRGIVLSTRDVSERRALEARLVHEAFHDSLTRLANRALFMDRVAHALEQARRTGRRVGVLYLDLDHFKQVNDVHGHARGDELLVAVANRLLNATRGCDTVARLGGDEFAVLLEAVAEDGDAVVVAERIRHALAAPLHVGTVELVMGASIGIALSQRGEECDELLRNADLAMYRAKQAGSGHELYAPEMYHALRERLALEEELRHAAARDELRLVFQPILDLADQRIVGAEALLRWHHPERGLVSPATFIPVAEETGLIVPIGRWVLQQACQEAVRWPCAPGVEPISVTVNISGRQLLDPALLDDISAALRASGLDAPRLVLEITESVAMQGSAQNLERLHALKALGVRLAIDDFGTGYSSLSYLQQFPIDVLKIDKAFIDGVARGLKDAALARTIIELGETLALRTIAEGIETSEQHARLHEFGCTLGQGYLFARPMPPNALVALLAGGAHLPEAAAGAAG